MDKNSKIGLMKDIEEMSPSDYLKSISPENYIVSKQDLYQIEELKRCGMETPVINVLISYIYLRTNGQLLQRYTFAIGSYWLRKEIKTAEQAMDMARKEYDEYQNEAYKYKKNNPN